MAKRRLTVLLGVGIILAAFGVSFLGVTVPQRVVREPKPVAVFKEKPIVFDADVSEALKTRSSLISEIDESEIAGLFEKLAAKSFLESLGFVASSAAFADFTRQTFGSQSLSLILARLGVSEKVFRQLISTDLLLSSFTSILRDAEILSDEEISQLVNLLSYGIEGEVYIFDLQKSALSLSVDVSDQDIEDFYEKNLARFNRPKLISGETGIIDFTAFRDRTKITDQDLAFFYEENLALFREEEEVLCNFKIFASSFVEVLSNLSGASVEVAASRLEELGVKPLSESQRVFKRGELEDFLKAFEPGRPSVRELKVNTSVGPITWSPGLAMCEVVKIDQPPIKKFDEIKDKVILEYLKKKAPILVSEIFAETKNSEAVRAKLGLTPEWVMSREPENSLREKLRWFKGQLPNFHVDHDNGVYKYIWINGEEEQSPTPLSEVKAQIKEELLNRKETEEFLKLLKEAVTSQDLNKLKLFDFEKQVVTNASLLGLPFLQFTDRLEGLFGPYPFGDKFAVYFVAKVKKHPAPSIIEKTFKNHLENIILQELALKAHLEGFELLSFNLP